MVNTDHIYIVGQLKMTSLSGELSFGSALYTLRSAIESRHQYFRYLGRPLFIPNLQ